MTARLAWVGMARATDVGRIRSHNEDRHLVRPPLIAVADGMGGARAGEVAAGIAIQALDNLTASPRPGDLRRAVEQANAEIRRSAAGATARAGMGTTVTACMLGDDGRMYVVHVGDSRAYLMRHGRLRRLTDDHSVVAELVRGGALTEEQANRHPQRSVITRALGATDRVSADAFQVGVEVDDLVLLCTDGISAMMDDTAIREALTSGASLDDAALALLAAADAAGGEDNATVVLARIGHGADTAVPEPAEFVPATPRVATLPRPTVEPGARTSRAPEPGRVLERVPTTRSRLLLAGVIVLAIAGVGAGATAWAASRSHVIQADDAGQVRLYAGLPYSVLGIPLMDDGRPIGVPATAVLAEDPSALDQGIQGEGEAVALATRLIWRYGLPVQWKVPAVDGQP